MGDHLSTNPVQLSSLVWRQTSRHGRLLLKEGGNFTIPQLDDGRTPRNFEHNLGNRERLLVASNEEGCY